MLSLHAVVFIRDIHMHIYAITNLLMLLFWIKLIMKMPKVLTYSTRRVFLRSYPLQWDWSPAQDDDKKDGLSPAHAEAAAGNRADHADGDECCGGSRRWKRQVVAAVTEWGEDKLLLLRRAKKRLALYLIGCHHHGHGRRALPFPSAGGSCTVAMLTSR